ncbi:12049_t:CDS:1, partial [Gigaspora margarita]
KPKKKQYNYQQGIPTLPRANTPTTLLVQYQRLRTPNQQILDNQVQRKLNQNYIVANPAPPRVLIKPPYLKYK